TISFACGTEDDLMWVTSQPNHDLNTLARNGGSPYSRVLQGPHLSDALGLLVRRLVRNSGLNHDYGKGALFVARRCVLCCLLCSSAGSFVQSSRSLLQWFFTGSTAFTKKEKRTKKERKAATAASSFDFLLPARNTYKGATERRQPRSGTLGIQKQLTQAPV